MNCSYPQLKAITGYTEGCRCERCKAEGLAYYRNYRKRNRKRIQETRAALYQFKKAHNLVDKKS